MCALLRSVVGRQRTSCPKTRARIAVRDGASPLLSAALWGSHVDALIHIYIYFFCLFVCLPPIYIFFLFSSQRVLQPAGLGERSMSQRMLPQVVRILYVLSFCFFHRGFIRWGVLSSFFAPVYSLSSSCSILNFSMDCPLLIFVTHRLGLFMICGLSVHAGTTDLRAPKL